MRWSHLHHTSSTSDHRSVDLLVVLLVLLLVGELVHELVQEAQLQYAAMRTQLGTFSEVTQSLQSIHPVRPLTAMDKMDALGDLHSQLHAKRVATVFWWILECLCIGHRDFDSGFEPRKSFR